MNFFEKHQKIFAIGGMIGPFLYALIWILGGILQPGYNHISDDVSSLLAIGAPNKLLFNVIEIIYVVLMMFFFISLHWTINKGKGSIIGPGLFAASFTVELFITLFFPLDAGGEIITITAQTHLALVGIIVVLTVIAMLALWRRFNKTEQWKKYATYTLITFILTLVFGLSAGPLGSDLKGLTERLTATIIGQYIFIIALKAYRLKE